MLKEECSSAKASSQNFFPCSMNNASTAMEASGLQWFCDTFWNDGLEPIILQMALSKTSIIVLGSLVKVQLIEYTMIHMKSQGKKGICSVMHEGRVNVRINTRASAIRTKTPRAADRNSDYCSLILPYICAI